MALMSGKTYSNTGTPSNADGVDGDIFMQLDGLKTTYRKEGGVWTAFGNQLGTIPEFLKGIGVPSNSLGADNQYYRDVNTDVIYEKSAGVWTNIGSWTSLAVSNLLESNGIGADLATTNHVSNIDTFIEAGAEGYFDSATTGTKPHTYGVVKVTKAGTELHQSSQTSTNRVATRVSGDTGTTWSVWRITANEDGDATRKFKALAGVAADDVVVMGQLTSALVGVLFSDQILDTNQNVVIFSTGVEGFNNLCLQWGYYDGAASDGTITFPLDFKTTPSVFPAAIYNSNVNNGQSATTHIKTRSIHQFSFASGVESGLVHNPTALAFSWFAIGVRG